MRKVLFVFFLLLFFPCHQIPIHTTEERNDATHTSETTLCQEMYEEMQLEGIVNFRAFRQAVAGYIRIREKKKQILTLIDFSKPSTAERLYVFDMDKKQLLHSSVVAHGRNSGEQYATSFSNISGTNKSSLGFYLTENTYNGQNGYSLVLKGLEQGINDKAKERAIVMHGASYADPQRVAPGGRLGRSLGCPAVPHKLAAPIINTIKDGSVLFIYANNSLYQAQSSILKNLHRETLLSHSL